MDAPYSVKWLTDPPKPGRQYSFGKRQDRRRIAMRLGANWSIEQTAMVERAHEGSLRALLRDDGFERLVAHYRELLSLDPDARLDRLTEMAFTPLAGALEAGGLLAPSFLL